jgi:hypothetical protein
MTDCFRPLDFINGHAHSRNTSPQSTKLLTSQKALAPNVQHAHKRDAERVHSLWLSLWVRVLNVMRYAGGNDEFVRQGWQLEPLCWASRDEHRELAKWTRTLSSLLMPSSRCLNYARVTPQINALSLSLSWCK